MTVLRRSPVVAGQADSLCQKCARIRCFLLGLTSSEKHIPQVVENTVKRKWLLDALESVVTRPRQGSIWNVRNEIENDSFLFARGALHGRKIGWCSASEFAHLSLLRN